jgi:hypothetical protein
VIGVAVPLGSVQATPEASVSVENFGQATLDPFRINQPPDFLIQSKSEKEVSIEKVQSLLAAIQVGILTLARY